MAWLLLFDALLALLVATTLKVLYDVYRHVQLMRKIREAPVSGLRGAPVFGILPLVIRRILTCPRGVPTNSYLLAVTVGMRTLFPNSGLLRLDLGWVKQKIVVSCNNWAEAILSDPNEQKKSMEYKFVSDFIGSGLITAPYLKWKRHRRILSPAFNPRVLESFHPVVYEQSNLMVDRMKSRIGEGNISVESELAQCSLAIVTETAMGIKYEGKSKGQREYLESVKKVQEIVAKRVVSPWFWSDILFHVSPTGRDMRKNLKVVHSFVEKIVQQKKKDLQVNPEDSLTDQGPFCKRRPFLELMLLHNMNCRPEDRLTDQEIEDETHTFTFAGFDTVSSTLGWIVYYMGLYPEVMRKAWAEIEDIFGGDRQRPILLEDLKRMAYLERVIKESQRMSSVVIASFRTLRNDVTLDGVTLPKGTDVVVSALALHMNEQAFKHPEVFDPDRFLDSKINPYQFVPFSAGPRNCIGQKYATMEMKTVMANLIRNFDWTSLDHRDKILFNPDLINRAHKPFRIAFRKRK